MSAISISKEGKERLYRNRLNNQVYLIKQSQNEISKYEISIDGEKWFYLPESSIKLYEEVNNENNKKMVIK